MQEFNLKFPPVDSYNQNDLFRPNARTIKFILTTAAEESLGVTEADRVQALSTFLKLASPETLAELFLAATSSDGYCYMPAYSRGYELLEEAVLRKRAITLETINQTHKRSCLHSLDISELGDFLDTNTGESLKDVVEMYSVMKFGGVAEINYFADQLAVQFLTDLDSNKNGVLDAFEWIADHDENVAIFVPGMRNVHTAASLVLERAIDIINMNLALENLPTIVKVRLPRFSSNEPSFSSLAPEERLNESMSKKTQLPSADFFKTPTHIIFGDGLRITGTTSKRIRDSVLANGALSFRELYIFVINPLISKQSYKIEEKLNTAKINGLLNQDVAYILNQPGFQPVQRIVKLVLDPTNREHLQEFLTDMISINAVSQLLIAATGNDYLRNPLYKDSGLILATVAEQRQALRSPLTTRRLVAKSTQRA